MVYEEIPASGTKKRQKVGNVLPQASGSPDGYYFAVVYASLASIMTYIVATRKAGVVGWQNFMMDVVHEIGANVGNLNIFNVGVADAKQTCAHACCVLHHSRKQFVYEGTSHAFHAAVNYVWSCLPEICELGKHFGTDIPSDFGFTPDFLTATRKVTTAAPGYVTLKAASDSADTVNMFAAFPLGEGDFVGAYAGDVRTTPGLRGATTDGDFTMWKRWLARLCPGMTWALMQDHFKAMGLRFCARHKGENIKQDGEKAVLEAVRARGVSESAYDKKHILGHLVRPGCFSSQLLPLLEVTRANPDPRVARIFWTLMLTKAKDMGLLLFSTAAERKHQPHNPGTGVFGQCTHVLLWEGVAWTGTMNKYGMSFTANCLEAGPNASLKRALGMQLSVLAIQAIILRCCTANSRLATDRGFSVRQDYVGRAPQYSAATNKQKGEERTGANWKDLWAKADDQAADPDFASNAMFMRDKRGVFQVSLVPYVCKCLLTVETH
jgi:hypothetical protein